MKTKLLFKLIIIVLSSYFAYGQGTINAINNGLTHCLWVADRGGGRSVAESMVLITSIGQPFVQRMEHIDTGLVLESGFLPCLRRQCGLHTSQQLNIAEGWNLISMPLIVEDYRKTILFPTAISNAFKYDNSYIYKDTLQNGTGYWLKFPDMIDIPVMGSSYTLDTTTVDAGWNIIGSISYPLLVSDILPIPPVTITSNFFKYDAGYHAQDTLMPGLGYWMKTSAAGQIVFNTNIFMHNYNMMALGKTQHKSVSSTSSKMAEDYGFSELFFTDAAGGSGTLYFGVNSKEEDMDKFELPPPPPSGIFDVRFHSNRMVAIADKNNEYANQSFPIIISGDKNPFTLSWNLQAGDYQYAIQIDYKGQQSKKYDLFEIDRLDINTEEIAGLKLLIEGNTPEILPKEYGLQQNFPNPFNPQTNIRYGLPVDSRVKIIVYSVVGEMVTTLLEENQTAGHKSVKWDASNFASGIYFYRLEAASVSDPGNTFTQVRKMILMK